MVVSEPRHDTDPDLQPLINAAYSMCVKGTGHAPKKFLCSLDLLGPEFFQVSCEGIVSACPDLPPKTVMALA